MAILEYIRPLALFLGIINVGLLVALLVIYIRSFIQIRSKFTAGLLIFASFMLLQKLLSFIFILRLAEFRLPGMRYPTLFMGLIEFVALAVLLWISVD